MLIVAPDDELLGPLSGSLDRAGWRTVSARSLGAATAVLEDGPVDVAIVDARSENIAAVVAALKAAPGGRRLPVLVVGAASAAGADLAMMKPPHPAQAVLRLEQLVRGAVAEEEFRLRRETFKAWNVDLAPREESARPLHVLAVGAADHRFLGLSNSLVAAGVEVVAAPTPYTAFDYLHERAFDAAVLWGGGNRTTALSIASGMKRNTRLYHVPLMLYLGASDEVDLHELYARGFADVAAAEAAESETAERIIALAQNHRRRQSIRSALDSVRASELTDPVTGLFTPALFAAHLERVFAAACARRRSLSICVLKVASNPMLAELDRGGWLERALPQVGAMISRLVRVEDTAAQLASDAFALMLPATSEPEARLTAERIAAVIACTAFEAGPGRSPFVVEFDLGVAEATPDDTPASLLERARSSIGA